MNEKLGTYWITKDELRGLVGAEVKNLNIVHSKLDSIVVEKNGKEYLILVCGVEKKNKHKE